MSRLIQSKYCIACFWTVSLFDPVEMLWYDHILSELARSCHRRARGKQHGCSQGLDQVQHNKQLIKEPEAVTIWQSSGLQQQAQIQVQMSRHNRARSFHYRQIIRSTESRQRQNLYKLRSFFDRLPLSHDSAGLAQFVNWSCAWWFCGIDWWACTWFW